MAFFLPALFSRLPQLTGAAVLDILLLAGIIYYLLVAIKGTRGVQILAGVSLLVLLYYTALWGKLQTIQWMLDRISPYLAFALIVLFQAEIRRTLAKIGRNPFTTRFSSLEEKHASEDIVMAATLFSSIKLGALIVMERETGLRTYTESGIPLRADLTYDLLIAIFQPGSPLHDGAVIIRKDKIVAAACFLPLSVSPVLGTQLGTRHRAAIGITEETDAVAITVSEETGHISLSTGGSIELNLSPEGLAQRLSEIFRFPISSLSLPVPVRAAPVEAIPAEHSGSLASGERT